MSANTEKIASAIEGLAAKELRNPSNENANALMTELHNMDPAQAREVQNVLRTIGSLSDPNCPEVRLHGTLSGPSFNANLDGFDISGEHYNSSWSWSKSPRTIRYREGSAPETPIESKTDIFSPSYERTLPNAAENVGQLRRLQWNALKLIFDF